MTTRSAASVTGGIAPKLARLTTYMPPHRHDATKGSSAARRLVWPDDDGQRDALLVGEAELRLEVARLGVDLRADARRAQRARQGQRRCYRFRREERHQRLRRGDGFVGQQVLLHQGVEDALDAE